MVRHALLALVVACLILATQALAVDTDEDPAADPSIVASDEGPTAGASIVDTDEGPTAGASSDDSDEGSTARWAISLGLGYHATSFYDLGDLQRDFGAYGSLGYEREISDTLHWHIRIRGLATNTAEDDVVVATGGLSLRQREEFPSLVMTYSLGVALWQRMHYDDEWGPAFVLGFGEQYSKRRLAMFEFCWAEPRHDWSVGIAYYFRLRF